MDLKNEEIKQDKEQLIGDKAQNPTATPEIGQVLKTRGKHKQKKSTLRELEDRFLWRDNVRYYNTVGYTQKYVSFFTMQMIRLVFFIALAANTILCIYIYVRKCLLYYNFWTQLWSAISFGCLFVGSGMQVCEQKLLKLGRKKNISTSHLWTHGIFIYNQTIPFVVVSNLIFWIPTFHVKEDVDMQISIYYTKNLSELTFRKYAIYCSNLLPLIAFTTEMFLNRIRIPLHHVIYCFFISLFYLAVSYVGQILQGDEAIYYHELNWMCHHDFSYILSLSANLTVSDLAGEQCGQRADGFTTNSTHACMVLYDYYCQDRFTDEYNPLPQKEFNMVNNRSYLILFIIIASVITFLVSYFIHNKKSGNYKGFNKRKFIRRINLKEYKEHKQKLSLCASIKQ